MSPVPRVCVSGMFTNALGTKSMIESFECTKKSNRKNISSIKLTACPNHINLGINIQKTEVIIYLCLSTTQKYSIGHIYQMSIPVFSTRRKDEKVGVTNH